MKIKVIVSTDDGCSYEGEVQLTPIGRKKTKSGTPEKSPQATSSDRNFDFTLPLRAFVTVNGARRLGGPQKFVLLLGGLTKGDTSAGVEIDRVQKEWNKMTAPMGGRFNSAYVTRAKDKGWVEPVKQGVYKLRSTWCDAIPS
jgi:hypothetical protein